MTLQPNPIPTEEVDTAYHFDNVEMTFKGMELRATSIDITRGHDKVVHGHLDIPGGDVEVTGRKSYVVDAEIVFFGTNWKERLNNATFLHDTEGDIEGELIVPDGPVFDAKWIDCTESWTGKNGKILRCQFIEHSHALTHQIMDYTPLSMARQAIPDEDSAILSPLLDDYESALDDNIAISQDALLTILYALDTAAYEIQIGLTLDSQDVIDRYTSLISVRANAVRACPYEVTLPSGF